MNNYNKFINVPKIPYAIIRKLALSKNENFWKVLFYDDYDCLSKPSLTFKQKMNLIWKNEADEQNFKIFLKPLVASETTKTTTQLRINNVNIKPQNPYTAILLYEFSIITGYKTAMINVDEIPVPRIDYLEQQLLEELNGKDLGVEGTQIFQFNRELDRQTQSFLNISNSKSFFGKTLLLGIALTNLREDCCG